MTTLPTIAPQSFVDKWRSATLKERSAYQEHFIDLCRLIGHPTPAEVDPTGENFAFEYGAAKTRRPGLCIRVSPSSVRRQWEKVQTTGSSLYRVTNGKIVEHWANMDFFGVLAQLGVIPMPGL